MPGFFSDMTKRLPYKSSAAHRSTQSINGITQVLSSSIQTFVSPAAVPAKFAQSMVSFYTLCRSDAHQSEKIMSTIQGLMSLTQLGLAIAALYENKNCNDIKSSDTLCQTIILFDMIYGGTLAALWALGKIAKNKDVDTEEDDHSIEPASNNP